MSIFTVNVLPLVCGTSVYFPEPLALNNSLKNCLLFKQLELFIEAQRN